jgi:hypothetical protein
LAYGTVLGKIESAGLAFFSSSGPGSWKKRRKEKEKKEGKRGRKEKKR